MASGLYDLGRQKILEGLIAILTDNIKVILADNADYTVNLATHEFRDPAVPDAAEVAVSGNLASKTSTAGVFDAADVTLSSITGDPSESLIVFKDSGTQTTSPLIAYIDTGTGLPVTPNGGDIVIAWDNGANKIFKL